MNIKTSILNLKNSATQVDWLLLAFLILFMDVKMAVKIPVIILTYLLSFNFKMGFSFKNSRLPLFYLIVIAIAIINWLIYAAFRNINYDVVFITGIGFWLLCILAIHQVKLAVERNTIEKVHNTILVFFVLNAIVSALVLCSIILEIHTINPYRYQGQFQKYFIGTGDYIKGLTFDVSTTNAVLNAIGVIYFLIRKNALMVLVCMAVMLLTGSNTINIMLIGVLALLFITKSTKDQKSLIVICLMFLAIFMFKVSPQNDDYIYKTYYRLRYKKRLDDRLFVTHVIPVTQKPDSILSPDERKEKKAALYLDSLRESLKPHVVVKQTVIAAIPLTAIKTRPEIPVPSIHTAPFQHKADTSAERLRLLNFVSANKASLATASQPGVNAATLPGKVIAMGQTLSFLEQHPLRVLTGTGIGNFSSKLAFKATTLGVSGGFPTKFAYINGTFLTNHLDVFLNFFSRGAEWHSLINSPNSIYDQLLSEYGLIGFVAFVVFYLGYFLKGAKRLTYGIPVMILMLGVFFLDYWFEQLSVIIFFELLMLLNIKETDFKTTVDGNE